MKAITLTQPWATLVAIGAKRIETRSWSTTYRGPLAIHAAKNFPAAARELLTTEPFHSVLTEHGQVRPLLPIGAVVATAELVGCYSTSGLDGIGGNKLFAYLPDQERAFGDFSPGRFAWILANVRPCNPPIPTKGALGLWEWPEGDRLVVAS